MKKVIMIGIILGMFGWAIYDYISENNQTTISETQNNEANEEFNSPERTAGVEATTGLSRGDQAPDFELETLQGETVKLSDYRGQPVMINFWATWCPPCRAEMPDMEKFYQNKEIEILAVNLTQTESNTDDVKDFAEEFQLSFSILMDTEVEVANTYEIQPIPTSYILDSNGIIQYKSLGALNYEQMVQQYETLQ